MPAPDKEIPRAAVPGFRGELPVHSLVGPIPRLRNEDFSNVRRVPVMQYSPFRKINTKHKKAERRANGDISESGNSER
jgi:hypothetical protein